MCDSPPDATLTSACATRWHSFVIATAALSRACSRLLAQAQQRAQHQGITAEQLRELLAWPSTPVPGLALAAPAPAAAAVPETTPVSPATPQATAPAQAAPAPSPAPVRPQVPVTPAAAASPSSHRTSPANSSTADNLPGAEAPTSDSPLAPPSTVTPGVLAVCNAHTEAECLHGPIYGTVDTPRNHSTLASINAGSTLLWFYNLDTQLIHGPFITTGSPAMNLDPQAFTGEWPRTANSPADASSPASRPTRFKLQVPIAAHAKHAELSCAHISQLTSLPPRRASELPCALSSTQVQQLLSIQAENLRNPDALKSCAPLPLPRRSSPRRARPNQSGTKARALAL